MLNGKLKHDKIHGFITINCVVLIQELFNIYEQFLLVELFFVELLASWSDHPVPEHKSSHFIKGSDDFVLISTLVRQV